MGLSLASAVLFSLIKIKNMRACHGALVTVIFPVLTLSLKKQNKTKQIPNIRWRPFSIISRFRDDCSFGSLSMWLGPSHTHWGVGFSCPVTRISSIPSQLNGAHVFVISQIHHCHAALWLSLDGGGRWGELCLSSSVYKTLLSEFYPSSSLGMSF